MLRYVSIRLFILFATCRLANSTTLAQLIVYMVMCFFFLYYCASRLLYCLSCLLLFSKLVCFIICRHLPSRQTNSSCLFSVYTASYLLCDLFCDFPAVRGQPEKGEGAQRRGAPRAPPRRSPPEPSPRPAEEPLTGHAWLQRASAGSDRIDIS